mmetsp:Transcript_19584/g.61573  ORF Transcript_19584/g.61573 Transcript_19584/m.61573 type:complete len:213 (+) Transcript_19584:324-962(+)
MVEAVAAARRVGNSERFCGELLRTGSLGVGRGMVRGAALCADESLKPSRFVVGCSDNGVAHGSTAWSAPVRGIRRSSHDDRFLGIAPSGRRLHPHLLPPSPRHRASPDINVLCTVRPAPETHRVVRRRICVRPFLPPSPPNPCGVVRRRPGRLRDHQTLFAFTPSVRHTWRLGRDDESKAWCRHCCVEEAPRPLPPRPRDWRAPSPDLRLQQ